MTSELDGGGVDRVLFDYCSRMLPDIQSDFLVSSDFEGMLEKPLSDMGCKIFHLPKIRDNLALRQKRIHEILSSTHYDCVHDHSGYKAFFLLKEARKAGVRCRIAHSHIAYIPEDREQRAVRAIMTRLTMMEATNLFACGEAAAEWMWGKKSVCFDGVRIMRNGVDVNQFAFSDIDRKSVRAEFGITDQFVVGNVARLSEQKNQLFLLKVFKELLNIEPNSRLFLVGRGELEEELKKAVLDFGLEREVLFLGVRNDVNRLLNGFDVFALPSLFEGLPVTLLEAQANGLPVVASSSITPECFFADNSRMISIGDNYREWAEELLRQRGNRVSSYSMAIAARDVQVLANEQKSWYLKHAK